MHILKRLSLFFTNSVSTRKMTIVIIMGSVMWVILTVQFKSYLPLRFGKKNKMITVGSG